jgi:hypothetical protein
LRGPIIERLLVAPPHKKHWAAIKFDNLLVELKNSERTDGTLSFFTKFEALAELYIPCDGWC